MPQLVLACLALMLTAGATRTEQPLDIVIYGASGKVGSHVVQEALQDDRGRTRVSRADFAVALIDEAEQARHVREQISVAY